MEFRNLNNKRHWAAVTLQCHWSEYLLFSEELSLSLTFWHRSFTFNSNKSPTWCNNFSVYYPNVCLQLNMFQAFSHPLSEAQWLQWQPLVLPSYRGDSRAVFVVGPAGRLKHVKLWTNVRIINWKIVASGWSFIWIVRWCTELQTLNFTFKF
jgi:hypothetical protein